VLALHFNSLSETRIKLNIDCHNKSLFCYIYNHDTIRKIELLIQTFTTTAILFYIILVVWCGRPSCNQSLQSILYRRKGNIWSVAIILMTNLMFYGVVIIYVKITVPTVYSLLYGIAQQYGLVTIQIKTPSK
jgi:hypothetical protein